MTLIDQIRSGFQSVGAELKKRPVLDSSGHLPIEVQRAPTRALKALQRPGAIAETCSRLNGVSNLTGFAQYRVHYHGIFLLKGTVVTNITFCYGAGGVTTLTNAYFALFDSNLNLISTTPNDATASWPAYTERTYALQTPFTVPADGIYYLGVCAEGSSNIALAGQPVGGALTLLAPAVSRSTTAAFQGGNANVPTTAPASFAAPSGLAWAWIS